MFGGPKLSLTAIRAKEAEHRTSLREISSKTREDIIARREEQTQLLKHRAVEDEKKKFEILKVLNLLEKTDIHSRDLKVRNRGL